MKMENNALTGKPYNIGYALSGGFIKGFAHLGVIQALLEHDIKPVSYTHLDVYKRQV